MKFVIKRIVLIDDVLFVQYLVAKANRYYFVTGAKAEEIARFETVQEVQKHLVHTGIVFDESKGERAPFVEEESI